MIASGSIGLIITVGISMNDDLLAFLLNAAGQLRELAQTAPEIATTLRQLADDLVS